MCDDPRVRVDGAPAERWLDAIRRACAELAEMPDSDPTSRVRLSPAGKDLDVEVVLEDGRTALRRVRDPVRLKATLDALLTLPPSSRRAEAAPPPPSPAAPASNRSEDDGVDRTKPMPPEPRLGFEVGVGVGGRFAGAQAYLSVAPNAYGALHIDDWLIGIGARWDVLQIKDDVGLSDFEMDTVGADLSVARRWHLGGWSLDIGASTRLLVETQSFRTPAGYEDTDAQTDLRLGPFARAELGRSSLRPMVALDGEISPGRIRRDIRVGPELPVLPAWSVGLSAGVAWGTP